MSPPAPNKQTISIRSATHADCERILSCLSSAFAQYESSYSPAAYADTVLTNESLRKRMDDMQVFVAVSGSGEIIGTIACKALDEDGHLRGMAVLPEWQGHGLAKLLLDRAESEMRDQGCKRITLDTTEPLKRAVRFYERNGFRSTGKVSDFFGMPLFEYARDV
jgi:GNAT superfamily N-acetyltransferase